MTESMEILFQECEGGKGYDKLCDRGSRSMMVFSLAITVVIRTLLVIISFGCKVPAGIFVPSMAVGAAFGRAVGIAVQALHESYPTSPLFSACDPDGPCITPGTYAFLGAAAALSGIMHITVSVVVIMFEITGALTYILPTMIVVGVTKAVSERLGHGGIADRMIGLNGYPFLDGKEDHTFNVPVSKVMASKVVCLPAHGMELGQVERVMSEKLYQGYPIVEDLKSKMLLGYIGRTELRYAIDRARKDGATAQTKCTFATADPNDSHASPHHHQHHSTEPTPSSPTSSSSAPTLPTSSLNLTRFTDPTPLSVHPRLPLETAMEVFKKMGPRVILIEYRGRLTGLVTVKDCLKYQVKVEAGGMGHAGVGGEAGMERVAALGKEVLRRIGVGIGRWVSVGGGEGLGGGQVRLESPRVAPGGSN